MDTAFRMVSMNVARNPVARAINAARLQSSVRDFRALRLALLLDGDDAGGDVHVCMQLIRVCLLAMVRSGFGQADGAEQLHRGQAVLLACAGRGCKWLRADVPAIDEALLCALEIYPQLKADAVAHAWREIRRI